MEEVKLKIDAKTSKKDDITKNDSLRITKLNEQKPEIKKIKKQEKEKKTYKLKEYVK